MRLLLTVPHAACPDRRIIESHFCDSVASHAADFLEKSLKNKYHYVVTLRAYVPRTMVDMNRREGRGTAWRAQVEATSADLLLDIHSFPGNEAGDDVYLLALTNPPLSWQFALARAIAITTKHVRLLQGTLENDIMVRATEMGIPSILIEFSELLDDTLLEKICDTIAKFVSSLEEEKI